MEQGTGRAVMDADGQAVLLGYFHPTFLYESVWCVLMALLLLHLDRRHRLGAGAVFALYVARYTTGRFMFELKRSDPANTILGLRVNTWVSALVFAGAVAVFLFLRHRAPSTASSWAGVEPVGVGPAGHGTGAEAGRGARP